jgi:poly-gamma-glutamate synthesis protein (capsule biosynthesis protein)
MSEVMLGFVGDVLVHRDDPHEVFAAVRDVLQVPDILLANLEGAYTDDPHPVPSAPSIVSAPARNLDAYSRAGFDVMCLANNHILDVGYEAMLESRARLRAQGVQTCGAGDSLNDARKPAVLEANGLRVAYLAYASVFPVGYEAQADKPGLAPMRAYNHWREVTPALHSPGRRPLASTVPDPTDLEHLAEDIRNARERADLVVTSFHWGDYWRRYHLTDHEKRTARFCIDHGAHMVVGHHHHVLRGMEWYKGKPILYGLGHFVFDSRTGWTDEEFERKVREARPATAVTDEDFVPSLRPGWPLLPFPDDARMTALAWARATRDGIVDVGFLPCGLRPDGLVHPLSSGSAESNEVVRYVEKCNVTQGLCSRLVAEGAPAIGGFPTVRMVPG